MNHLYIRSVRGDIPESEHAVSVSVVSLAQNGSIKKTRSFGRDWPFASLRSAAKPFQALQLFDGAVDRFDITPQEIALACSSHNSERTQVECVRGLLHRIGLSESDLVCGPHRSLIKEAGIILSETTEPDPELEKPSSIASNCSGKHTGMLAVALTANHPTKGYHELSHPVQAGARSWLSKMSGIKTDRLANGIDGCGVVCWAMPLESLALAYARLCLGGEPERAIVAAMTTHPEFVAGARRTCTAIMQAFPGQILAKFGACGVYGAAFPDERIGVAIKVHDGNGPATSAALIAVVDQLGLLTDAREKLPDYAEPKIANTRHEIVGKYEPVGLLANSVRAPKIA